MYPTIKGPTKIDTTIEDGSIKSKFENGMVQARSKFTRVRKTFDLTYILPIADKNTLLAFYNTVRLAGEFDWINPDDGKTYTVRFKTPIKYDAAGANVVSNITLTLEEV